MTQRYSTKATSTSEHYVARGQEDGSITLGKVHGPHDEAVGRGATISRKEATALAPVFEDQKDIQLGRWRSEAKPWMVVYPIAGTSPMNDAVRVLNERTADVEHYNRKSRALSNGAGAETFSDFEYAAKAYFNAHKPVGPWLDAAHNEIWQLNFQDGSTGAFIANTQHSSGKTVFANADTYLFAESDTIRFGERIYPKKSN